MGTQCGCLSPRGRCLHRRRHFLVEDPLAEEENRPQAVRTRTGSGLSGAQTPSYRPDRRRHGHLVSSRAGAEWLPCRAPRAAQLPLLPGPPLQSSCQARGGPETWEPAWTEGTCSPGPLCVRFPPLSPPPWEPEWGPRGAATLLCRLSWHLREPVSRTVHAATRPASASRGHEPERRDGTPSLPAGCARQEACFAPGRPSRHLLPTPVSRGYKETLLRCEPARPGALLLPVLGVESCTLTACTSNPPLDIGCMPPCWPRV